MGVNNSFINCQVLWPNIWDAVSDEAKKKSALWVSLSLILIELLKNGGPSAKIIIKRDRPRDDDEQLSRGGASPQLRSFFYM